MVKPRSSISFVKSKTGIALITTLLSSLSLHIGLAYAAEPQAFTVNQAPLFLSAPVPNVLLLLDNSNSFDERPDGVPVGSGHLTSKSVIARTALRNIVTAYQNKISLGIMTYKQNGLGANNVSPSAYDASFEPSSYDPTFTRDKAAANNWESFPFSGAWATSSYTGSYTAAAKACAAPYACPYTFTAPHDYTGFNWSDTTFKGERRGQAIQYANLSDNRPWFSHPYDFVYYNTIQASYMPSLAGLVPSPGNASPPALFCYSADTVGLHGSSAGAPAGIGTNYYTCRYTKTAPLAGFLPDGVHGVKGNITSLNNVGPTTNNATANTNMTNHGFSTTPNNGGQYGATDSDQAQGFTTFGRFLVDFGGTLSSVNIPASPTFYTSNAPGPGNLRRVIQPLTSAVAANFNNVLQCNIPLTWAGGATYVRDPDTTAACSPGGAGTGIANGGATASAGSLKTALRYFQGNITDNENASGVGSAVANVTGSAAGNLPVSCGKNYIIFVTDGMPTHDQNGAMYATPALGVADTVAAAQELQNAGILVYIIGFGAAVQQSGLDQIAAAGGTGSALVASDGDGLNSALSHVFNDVIVRSASAASVATNSAQFSVDSFIYQARFTSLDWSGQLLKFQTDNTTGAVAAAADWEAGRVTTLQAGNGGWSPTSSNADRRQIITAARPQTASATGKSVGVPFAWPSDPANPTASELLTWQTTSLNKTGGGVVDSLGLQRLNWVRGDRSNEGTTATTLRLRTTVLGDIVNSYPLYMGPPSSQVSGTGYYDFKQQYASRKSVIIAGANDGMLHVFDTTDGKELLAYIPSHAFSNNPTAATGGRLSVLTNQSYKSLHTYIVDGTPVSGDVYYDSAWHTAVVAGVGGGGQSYFALNLTNTSSDTSLPDPTLKESNADSLLLWEFTDRNTNTGTINAAGVPTGTVNGDADLGYTFSKPLIVQANNGKWVAIFGNGYNNRLSDGSVSTTGYGALYIVDIATGNLIRKISVPVGTTTIPNGLGSPRGLDARLTGKTDYVYAGDLYGNLWKFDLTSNNPASWGVAYTSGSSPAPLFTINNVGTNGNRRPITGEIRVTPNPSGGYMIVFGSGRYIAPTAVDTPASYDATSMDSLYSIWDTGVAITGGRGWLNGQTLQNATTVSNNVYRQLTRNATTSCNYGNTPSNQSGCTLGCYVDLTDYPNSGYNGERFTYFPQLTAGAVSFNTIIPSTNICAAGGNSENVIFDYLTCSNVAQSPFDTNNDSTFSASDLVTFNGTLSPAGSKVLTGITPPGTRIYNAANGQIYVYNSSSLGGNPTQDRLQFAGSGGRVSWREVKPQQQ